MPLTKEGYRPRLIDTELAKHLASFGAVCLEGPKWCGKTWTSLNQANSVVYIGNPENNFQNRALAELSPDLVLEGESPRLVDEWQQVPSIWDAVRFAVDQRPDKGRYILTGSATPRHKGILHSGTGRISSLRMRTMSLFESGDSSGQVSLQSLFGEPLMPVRAESVTLDRLIAHTVRGGWPNTAELVLSNAMEAPKAYLKAVVEDDMFQVDGVARDYHKVRLLLQSLARNESTTASIPTLRRGIIEYEGDDISLRTIGDYLNVLERLFLLENQPAFNPNLRSSVRVGKSAKRHFVDPSLAVASLGATPDMLKNDLKTFGFLFEALCERDLRIYAESWGGHLYHYRDGTGREIDAVIELPDGRWGAFEIKLGGNQIDSAAAKLLDIQQWMKQDPNARPPEILCVLCGMQNYAATRPDGVMVIPITALRS
ncbi:MAG TPA: DUF4143 domain-containing protein [Clostridia bacterium]